VILRLSRSLVVSDLSKENHHIRMNSSIYPADAKWFDELGFPLFRASHGAFSSRSRD
jgi:hypothetical protein